MKKLYPLDRESPHEHEWQDTGFASVDECRLCGITNFDAEVSERLHQGLVNLLLESGLNPEQAEETVEWLEGIADSEAERIRKAYPLRDNDEAI